MTLEQLEAILDEGTIEIPRGLTREQRRAYVSDQLAKIIAESFIKKDQK